MNQTMETILKRRSHRTFLQDEVKQEDIETIVEAGIYAPSAMNQQPWHLAVVTNKELLDELNQVTKEVAQNADNDHIAKMAKNEKLNIFYNAPAVIIVSCEEGKYAPEVDCAAATQNMLLAAESLDLASCWIGFITFLFKMDPVKAKEYAKRLGIPEGYMPSHAVAIGHKKNKELKAPVRRENTVSYVK